MKKKTPPMVVKKFLRPFIGNISVPGSKSLTNRIFPLGVLSRTPITMNGALESEDAEVMQDALKTLRANIEALDETSTNFKISSGKFFEDENQYIIDCKNSGTSIRFLTALCSLRRGNTTLTGIERMKSRPIGDLVSALRQMGIEIEYLEKENFPPIRIIGGTNFENQKTLKKISLPGNLSSQYFTALFHIAPLIGLEIEVEGTLVSRPYIDMTIEMMKNFGIKIENQHYQKFVIPKQKILSPRSILVEGDASSSSYPLAIAAITGGSCVIKNLPKNSLQGDAKFQELVIDKMRSHTSTPFSDRSNKLLPLGEINLEDIPDVAMTAVVLCAYAKGYSKITGLSTLRHKECDRIFALQSNLQKMGIRVESSDDSMEIWGDPENIHGAEIECFDDHRVAMCFAVLGTVVENIVILDPDCTAKTYPGFWDDLEGWRR